MTVVVTVSVTVGMVYVTTPSFVNVNVCVATVSVGLRIPASANPPTKKAAVAAPTTASLRLDITVTRMQEGEVRWLLVIVQPMLNI